MKGSLTPDEQDRIIEIQDLLIDRFVARKHAIDSGTKHRAWELQQEIDDLLREKRDIEAWAVFGSA